METNTSGTDTVDNKASGTSKPADPNVKPNSQSSAQHTAGGQQQRQYYRRLIRRRYMDVLEAANDPEMQESHDPESVCLRKLYGPDNIEVITTEGVPYGWVLVNRKIPHVSLLIHRS